jgi:serralysin
VFFFYAIKAYSLTVGTSPLSNQDIGWQKQNTIGSFRDDALIGSDLDDLINGFAGDDRIICFQGSDTIDGGDGFDVVYYEGPRDSYFIKKLDQKTILIQDKLKLAETDSARNVEKIEFDYGALIFDVESANAPAAYRLYGGAFDRTPDEGGFRFWTSTLDKNVSLHAVATEFIRSDEFIARYGATLSNSAFVDALYQNVLDRRGDSGGIAHWNRMLDNKLQDRADVLVEFTQLPEFVGISAANITNGYWVV